MADSPSTSHIWDDRKIFVELVERKRRPVQVGEGQLVDVTGTGTVISNSLIEGQQSLESSKVMMRAVLYVPAMLCSLLSASRARKANFKTMFGGENVMRTSCPKPVLL